MGISKSMKLIFVIKEQKLGTHFFVLLNSHDYIHAEWERPQGPRALTVFMYLNDVAGGGGTHFNRLNLTVMPKRGKVVVWPSILDEDPLEWDERTHHEALPVTKVSTVSDIVTLQSKRLDLISSHYVSPQGKKFGANAWVHLRDYKVQSAKHCV